MVCCIAQSTTTSAWLSYESQQLKKAHCNVSTLHSEYNAQRPDQEGKI
jgi:hypothetical protein